MNLNPPNDSYWEKLGTWLQVVVPYHNDEEASWLPPSKSDGDELPRVRVFQIEEEKYLDEVETAILQWCDTFEFPKLSKKGQYFLSLRFMVISSLFSSFHEVGDALPFPYHLPRSELFKRFLIDWWEDNGAYFAVGITCAEDEGFRC